MAEVVGLISASIHLADFAAKATIGLYAVASTVVSAREIIESFATSTDEVRNILLLTKQMLADVAQGAATTKDKKKLRKDATPQVCQLLQDALGRSERMLADLDSFIAKFSPLVQKSRGGRGRFERVGLRAQMVLLNSRFTTHKTQVKELREVISLLLQVLDLAHKVDAKRSEEDRISQETMLKSSILTVENSHRTRTKVGQALEYHNRTAIALIATVSVEADGGSTQMQQISLIDYADERDSHSSGLLPEAAESTMPSFSMDSASETEQTTLAGDDSPTEDASTGLGGASNCWSPSGQVTPPGTEANDPPTESDPRQDASGTEAGSDTQERNESRKRNDMVHVSRSSSPEIGSDDDEEDMENKVIQSLAGLEFDDLDDLVEPYVAMRALQEKSLLCAHEFLAESMDPEQDGDTNPAWSSSDDVAFQDAQESTTSRDEIQKQAAEEDELELAMLRIQDVFGHIWDVPFVEALTWPGVNDILVEIYEDDPDRLMLESGDKAERREDRYSYYSNKIREVNRSQQFTYGGASPRAYVFGPPPPRAFLSGPPPSLRVMERKSGESNKRRKVLKSFQLFGPHGHPILPSAWQRVIEPGDIITMRFKDNRLNGPGAHPLTWQETTMSWIRGWWDSRQGNAHRTVQFARRPFVGIAGDNDDDDDDDDEGSETSGSDF